MIIVKTCKLLDTTTRCYCPKNNFNTQYPTNYTSYYIFFGLTMFLVSELLHEIGIRPYLKL